MSDTWRSVPAGSVARIEIGGTPSRDELSFWADRDNGHPWASIADLSSSVVTETAEYISDLGVRSSNVKLVPAGTPIMSFKLTIGRTSVAGRDLYTNEAIAAFFVDPEQVDRKFLFHALPGVARSVVTDVAIKGATLNKKSMLSMQLQLPPIEEQRRIRQALDTLDRLIRASEAVQAKLRATFRGLADDLLSRGVAGDGKLRDPALNRDEFVSTQIGLIPRSWRVMAVSDLGESVTGATPPGEVGGLWGGSTPFVTPGDISDGVPVASSERSVSDRGRRFLRIVPTGSILVVCIGSTIGKSAVSLVACATNQQINALTLAPGHDPVFVDAAIRRERRRLLALAGLQAVPIVNRTQFESLRVPVAPAGEQAVIGQILASYQERIDREASRLEKLCTVKTGLVDDLLSGRIRVPAEAAS